MKTPIELILDDDWEMGSLWYHLLFNHKIKDIAPFRDVWACRWACTRRGTERPASRVSTCSWSTKTTLIESFAKNRHANHHDHSDNIDLADLVLDTEHILDDLDIYTERELDSMNVDEKVCLKKYDIDAFQAENVHRCSLGSTPMIGIWTSTWMDSNW